MRSRMKKSDREMVAGYARLAEVPKAKRKRRVRLTIVLGPRQRGADPDAFWKGLLDSLVAAELLVDDSKEWVELAPVEYERGKERATRIVLEDM